MDETRVGLFLNSSNLYSARNSLQYTTPLGISEVSSVSAISYNTLQNPLLLLDFPS